MTDSITRCPKCQTSFRINEEHLKTARGAVRCGSCLTVFDAREHLIVSQSTISSASNDSPETDETQEHKTPLKTEVNPDEDDNILISDDMNEDDEEQSPGFDENVYIAHNSAKSDLNLFERNLKSIDQDLNIKNQDESWALHLLDDDESADKQLSPNEKTMRVEKKEHTSFAAASSLIDKDKIERPLNDMFAHRQQSKFDAPDDALLDESSMHADDGERTDESVIAHNDNTEEQDFHAFFQDDDADAYMAPDYVEHDDYEERIDNNDYGIDNYSKDNDVPYDTPALHNEHDDDTPATHTKPGHRSTHIGHQDFLEDFEPDPVEMLVANEKPFWQSTPFWFLLSTIALLAIIAQLAYFQFDSLARKSPYRAYYASACEHLGCSLPVLQNVKKIRIDSMTVIAHPQNPGLLMVDAVISNQADYEQYFPTLQLHFTDARGKSVRNYIFQPSEYVGGELAGRDLMPQSSPIHIVLEIEDPGPDAVNYQIAAVKP